MFSCCIDCFSRIPLEMAEPPPEYRVDCYMFSLERISRHGGERATVECTDDQQNRITLSRGLSRSFEHCGVPFPRIIPHHYPRTLRPRGEPGIFIRPIHDHAQFKAIASQLSYRPPRYGGYPDPPQDKLVFNPLPTHTWDSSTKTACTSTRKRADMNPTVAAPTTHVPINMDSPSPSLPNSTSSDEL